MKADAKGDHLAVTLHNALDLSSIPHVESHNSRSDDVSSFTSGSVPISHVPRGWERKPVSPNQQHRRGRKVWKREDAEPFVNAQASAQLLSDLSADATGHDTKRQRTQQIPTLPAKASKQLQYAAIGTDPPVNTPKRKAARRKGTRKSVSKRKSDAGMTPLKPRAGRKSLAKEIIVDEPKREASPEVTPRNADSGNIQALPLMPISSEQEPAKTPEEALGSPTDVSGPVKVPDEEQLFGMPTMETPAEVEHSLVDIINGTASVGEVETVETKITPQSSIDSPVHLIIGNVLEEETTGTLANGQEAILTPIKAEGIFIAAINAKVDDKPWVGSRELQDDVADLLSCEVASFQEISGNNSGGTASVDGVIPTHQVEAVNMSSVDTLLLHSSSKGSPRDSEMSDADDTASLDSLDSQRTVELDEEQQAIQQAKISPLQTFEHHQDYTTEEEEDLPDTNVIEDTKNIDQGDCQDHEADSSADELYENDTAILYTPSESSPNEPPDSPSPRQKRSVTPRLSDDTSLLKDFLSRAKAKAAGKSSYPKDAGPSPVKNPRTPCHSPRTVLGDLDSNSPSPTRPEIVHSPTKGTKYPGTPPANVSMGNFLTAEDDTQTLDLNIDIDMDPDELLSGQPSDHLSDPGTSVRRSGRSRLPAPTRLFHTPGAPNAIPVRRADGTEHFVLQKSEAVQLSLMTRANTRRNKGLAQLPKSVLEGMGEKEPSPVKVRTTGGGRVSGKNVGWDERLVYFQIEGMKEAMDKERQGGSRILKGEKVVKEDASVVKGEGEVKGKSSNAAVKTKTLAKGNRVEIEPVKEERADKQVDAAPTEEKEVKNKPKTSRLRVPVIRNGTPAPKRRLKVDADSAPSGLPARKTRQKA